MEQDIGYYGNLEICFETIDNKEFNYIIGDFNKKFTKDCGVWNIIPYFDPHFNIHVINLAYWIKNDNQKVQLKTLIEKM